MRRHRECASPWIANGKNAGMVRVWPADGGWRSC
jgi:hypothetical protein